MPNGQVPQVDPNAARRGPTLREGARVQPPAPPAMPTQPDAQQALQPSTPTMPPTTPAPVAPPVAPPTPAPTAQPTTPPTTQLAATSAAPAAPAAPTAQSSGAVMDVMARGGRFSPLEVKRYMRDFDAGAPSRYYDPSGKLEKQIAFAIRSVDPDVMKKQRGIAFQIMRTAAEDRISWRHFGPMSMDLLAHAADIGGNRRAAAVQALELYEQTRAQHKLTEFTKAEKDLQATFGMRLQAGKRAVMGGLMSPGELGEMMEDFIDESVIQMLGPTPYRAQLASSVMGLEMMAPAIVAARTDSQSWTKARDTVWEGVQSNRFAPTQAANGVGVMYNRRMFEMGQMAADYQADVEKWPAGKPITKEDRFLIAMENTLPPASWAALSGVLHSDNVFQAAGKLREEGKGLNVVYLGGQLMYAAQELLPRLVEEAGIDPKEGLGYIAECYHLMRGMGFQREIGALVTNMQAYNGMVGGVRGDLRAQRLAKASALASTADFYTILEVLQELTAIHTVEPGLEATATPAGMPDAVQAGGDIGRPLAYYYALMEFADLLDTNTSDRRMLAEYLQEKVNQAPQREPATQLPRQEAK